MLAVAGLPRQWVEEVEPQLDDAWAGAAGLFNAGVALTSDELNRVQEELEELLLPYLNRSEADRPEAARRVTDPGVLPSERRSLDLMQPESPNGSSSTSAAGTSPWTCSSSTSTSGARRRDPRGGRRHRNLYAVYSQLAQGPHTPGQLSETLGVRPTTLSGYLATMAGRGRVQVQNDHDGRSSVLALTEAGQAKVRECRPLMQRALKMLNAEIGLGTTSGRPGDGREGRQRHPGGASPIAPEAKPLTSSTSS